MARVRFIKPGFFTNDTLAELEPVARLLFIALWCLADREGRLEDRPKRIKAEALPYDNADVDQLLDQLMQAGFIIRYTAEGSRWVQVVNFIKHQQPHYKEVASKIPAPPGHIDSGYVTFGVSNEQRERIMKRDGYQCVICGSTERLTIDHIVPRSKGGSGEDDNLRVLCNSCNSRKGNREAKAELEQGSTNVASSSPQVRLNVATSLPSVTVTVTDTVTYTDPYSVTEDHLPPTSPDDGERHVVSDASASSRDDEPFFDEEYDLAYLDSLEPETPEDSAPSPAHPANVTALPTARTQAVATSTAPVKRPPKARTTWAEDSEPMRLACYLKTKILIAYPEARTPGNLNAWATDMDRLLRIDKHSYDSVKAVIDYATTDTFWQTVILSAGKLRDKYDTLAGQMKRKQQRQGENYHNGHTATGQRTNGSAGHAGAHDGTHSGDASASADGITDEQRRIQQDYIKRYGLDKFMPPANAAS